ncbi:MAG: hypothetical protein H6744_19940 [Deltaproteobacteria bacterium]|nr:hypothetical protein [Deltaproteobacteria bacterium]MCB9788955.1 hypothetical protein [Deltaproteobacteria bacterium]
MSEQALRARVAARVEAVLERHAFRGTGGAGQRLALERDVASALAPLVRGGHATRVDVRCDDDTCEGSPAPVVEVVLSLPRRVERVVLRFTAG